MPAVDYTDAAGTVNLSATPLNAEIGALIEHAAVTELPRGFLGASAVGHECARQIQLSWWCRPLLADRIRLIFSRGHFFEKEARERLIAAGFVFAPPEALKFVALDGDLQGHADGILIAGPVMPEAYAFPCVWECKALNAKNWRAVERDGFAKVFPRYAVQISLYQAHLHKQNPALVTCVNADTCELLHFSLPFNDAMASLWTGRAAEIIAATRKGELLPRFTNDPTDWRCRICDQRDRCWKLPE
jgi:hypothetical protein